MIDKHAISSANGRFHLIIVIIRMLIRAEVPGMYHEQKDLMGDIRWHFAKKI